MEGIFALMIHSNVTSGNLCTAIRILPCKQQQGQFLAYQWIPDMSLDGNQRETLEFTHGNEIGPWHY